MPIDTYFLNDGYTWYPLLGLMQAQLGARWALAGDVAAILYGYASRMPVQTIPNPLLEIQVEKDNRPQQRVEALDTLRSIGFHVHADDLTFEHLAAGLRGTLQFVPKLDIQMLPFPVVRIEHLIENKQHEWEATKWNPKYARRVLAPQMLELVSIAAAL